MKWIFVYNLTHESYGGNTHRDGQTEVIVSARTEQSARRKADGKVRRDCRGYDARLVSISRA